MIILVTFLGRSSEDLSLGTISQYLSWQFCGLQREPLSPAPDPEPVCWASSQKSKQGPRSHTPILINSFIHLFNKYLMSFYQVRNLSPRRKTELYVLFPLIKFNPTPNCGPDFLNISFMHMFTPFIQQTFIRHLLGIKCSSGS